MRKIKNKSRYNKRIIVLAALGVIFVYMILALVFKFWPLHKHVTITASSVQDSLPSSSSATSTNKHASSSSSDGTEQTANDNPKTPTQVQDTNKTLNPPSGTFVNLYNADADTQMNSICNTTPGANCQVVFTKGSLSIALPAKTSDSSGAATWAWTPQQIGLTTGSWHVVAKATLGSQTKTTDNGSLELVIQ